jgi:light-regulated signal transduction histidine kinase (bacteriophytochrome)
LLRSCINWQKDFKTKRFWLLFVPTSKNHSLPSKIQIRTEVVSDNWIAVRIADNGPGISESVKTRLFDPFFTTKPVGQGTGLGLSISYEIVVERHGGKLYCQSAPGQGTEFVIEIPMQQKCILLLNLSLSSTLSIRDRSRSRQGLDRS